MGGPAPEPYSRPFWALIVKSGARTCAVPLQHVVETMRPLPVEPIEGMPLFIRGMSVIRGVPTPVVDLDSVLGTPAGEATRFVTVRVSSGTPENHAPDFRQVALSVGDVTGVRNLADFDLADLPPLLGTAANGVVERIGALDLGFLMLLNASWELPEAIWRTPRGNEAD